MTAVPFNSIQDHSTADPVKFYLQKTHFLFVTAGNKTVPASGCIPYKKLAEFPFSESRNRAEAVHISWGEKKEILFKV